MRKKIVVENRDINSKLKNRDSYFSQNRAGLLVMLFSHLMLYHFLEAFPGVNTELWLTLVEE